MVVFPGEINELDKAVIEKLIETHGSQEYSTCKLVDCKLAADKWNEKGWDKKEIEEAVERSQATYWFRYQDNDGGDHELKVEERYSGGKLHTHHIKGSGRWTRRSRERGELDPEIFNWDTSERLA